MLKWEAIHPSPDQFAFAAADAYVSFGTDRGMLVHGHTLVWHMQTPAWVFTEGYFLTAGRDRLLSRLENHISAVVGRYKGRIGSWDVVNEAVGDDGRMRLSPWFLGIGDDYVEVRPPPPSLCMCLTRPARRECRRLCLYGVALCLRRPTKTFQKKMYLSPRLVRHASSAGAARFPVRARGRP